MKTAIKLGCSSLLLGAFCAEMGGYWTAGAFAFIAFCALVYIVSPGAE